MIEIRNNKYYRNGAEITKDEYDLIVSKLPKPKMPTQEEIEREQRIEELKKELSSYYYIGVELAMGVSTKEEYAKEIAYCEELRKQIRALEG